MLTLTRKVGQRILIGDDIEVVIREVRGRQVRIGIVAPAQVEVFREEVAPPSLAASGSKADAAKQSDDTESDAQSDAQSDSRSDPPSETKRRRGRVVDDT